jgi:hypothetical protein
MSGAWQGGPEGGGKQSMTKKTKPPPRAAGAASDCNQAGRLISSEDGAFLDKSQVIAIDSMCRELGLQLARAVQPEPAVLAHIDHELDQHLVDLVDLLGLSARAVAKIKSSVRNHFVAAVRS